MKFIRKMIRGNESCKMFVLLYQYLIAFESVLITKINKKRKKEKKKII